MRSLTDLHQLSEIDINQTLKHPSPTTSQPFAKSQNTGSPGNDKDISKDLTGVTYFHRFSY